MAERHRATDKQWRGVKALADDIVTYSCILELLCRIEALESAASTEVRPTVNARITRDRDETGDYLIVHDASPNHPEISDNSLVERLALTLAGPNDDAELWMLDARAAIREVADWMRENPDVHFPPALVFALEQEAER